jgi:hypothetical protein
MLYAGLDLSRQRLDVHVLDEEGRTVEVTAVRPDADGLGSLAAVTGARFVHGTLERSGWDVAIADAVKAKGLAPLAAKSAWNGRLLRQQDRGHPRAVEGATGSLKGADRVQRASGR